MRQTDDNTTTHSPGPPAALLQCACAIAFVEDWLGIDAGTMVLALSGLAVVGQSGLLTSTLEDEARECAVLVWGVAGALIVSGAATIIHNTIKRRRARR